MATVQESPEHAACCSAVRKIEESLLDLGLVEYEPRELQDISVQILPMPLSDDGNPSFEPCFFRPFEKPLEDPNPEEEYPSYELPKGWDSFYPIDYARGTIGYFTDYLQYLTSDSERSQVDSPGREHLYYQTGGLGFKPLYGVDNDLDWRGMGIRDIQGCAHFRCMMISDIDGDNDKITRGELVCILRIMERLFNSRKRLQYMVNPVMLLSFMAPRHGRIMQAHYDGARLIVRKSDLFDFGNKNIAAMKLFMRWWCSSAIGDTISG